MEQEIEEYVGHHYRGFSTLIECASKLQEDWSIQKQSYSWEMEGETYYNFEGFEFVFLNKTKELCVFMNLSLDPAQIIYLGNTNKGLEKVFKEACFETIKFIKDYGKEI